MGATRERLERRPAHAPEENVVRAVLSDVERVGGRHVEEIIVKELVAERCGWECNRGFECSPVTEASRSAEKPELVVVQRQKILDSEEQRIRARRNRCRRRRLARSGSTGGAPGCLHRSR
jgi:hypothetical protein